MTTGTILRRTLRAAALTLSLLLCGQAVLLSSCAPAGDVPEDSAQESAASGPDETTPASAPDTDAPGTDQPTEPGTDAPTEPVTDAPTEPATDPVTEPVTEPETEPYADPTAVVLYDFSDMPESLDWTGLPWGIANPLLMTDNDKTVVDSGWAFNVTLPNEAAWCQSFTLDFEETWTERAYIRLWVNNMTSGALSVGLTLYTPGQTSSACPKAEDALTYTSDGRRVFCAVNDTSGMGAGVNTSVELPAGFRGWVAFRTDALTNRRDEPFLSADPTRLNIDVRPVGFVGGESYILDELVLSDRPDGEPRGGAVPIVQPAAIAERKAQIADMMEKAVKEPVRVTEVPSFDPDGQYTGIRAITYDGVDRGGKKTKIFAYVGYPEGADGHTPGIVLIHGGGGHSFLEWCKRWMDQGYAVIAPDVTGYFPAARNAGAVESADGWSFGLSGVFAEDGYTCIPNNDGMGTSTQAVESQWMYHALAASAKAFTVLSQSGKCDPERIGVTGISWGGVITSLYIGYDPRPAFAIPVYGTAYLDEGLSWIKDNFAGSDTRALWSAAERLDRVKCPVLWLVWNDDNCFSLNSASKSYLDTRAVAGTRLAAVNGMLHGHSAAWVRPESYAFADSVVQGGDPLPRFVTLPGASDPSCTVENASRAKLYYITSPMTYSTHTKYGSESTYMDQEWRSVTISLKNGRITGEIPADAAMYYIELSAKGGVVVTSGLVTVRR